LTNGSKTLQVNNKLNEEDETDMKYSHGQCSHSCFSSSILVFWVMSLCWWSPRFQRNILPSCSLHCFSLMLLTRLHSVIDYNIVTCSGGALSLGNGK
jgi:hypothetical protein